MSKKPVIVFEGIEGSGKSFHISNVSNYLKKRKIDHIKIREPGGSLNAEKIRKLVHTFQIKSAYNPPKKYNGSCLDGRDITYKIIPDADFKFFITANTKTRALRRYKELKALNKKISYEVSEKTNPFNYSNLGF